MTGSIFLYGGTKEERGRQIDELLRTYHSKPSDNPDILYIDNQEGKKTIGIDQIRSGIKFLSQKPLSEKYKTLVVKEADKLTPDAQNAFLKILEEPPVYANIILSAKTEESLLPTILSRCKRIQSQNPPAKGHERGAGDQVGANHISSILKMSVGERLSLAEELSKAEREDVIKMMEDWLLQLRETETAGAVMAQNNIQDIKNDLEQTNVNLRIALEHLFLSL